MVAHRFIDDISTISQQADRIALIDGQQTVTYAELFDQVRVRRDDIGLNERSLVILTGDRTLDYVVTYLALLDAGHVPLLAGDHVDALADAWDPAAVITASADGVEIDHRVAPAIDLHHDLALLLSTSGSTGSPKLVRLSQSNLSSNARAIGEYLGLGPDDRGITTLPLHYCYGLSILHSHLAAGASVVLTTASVVDPCFRRALYEHRVTDVAGVPHTFEMLEQADPQLLDTPSMRIITQAGGRLAPDDVRRWTHRADDWDAEFFVMYGQTEATARMAFLPPELARHRPDAIGVAIPGGEFSLRHDADLERPEADDVGELIYRGPNVMLGYAETHADLGRGGDIEELATGDIARFHADDGVYEIIGRKSRFVKPFGVRVDLARVESSLPQDVRMPNGVAVGGDDRRLVVVAPGARSRDVAAAVGNLTGLPASRISVNVDHEVPRTSAGKVDYAAVTALAPDTSPTDPGSSVAATLCAVLDRPGVGPDDTFVSLGGDSLSYVECSIRLERMLGTLPKDWHMLPVSELESLTPRAPRRWARMDTTVLLRTIAICAVVATHMRLKFVPGGAHLLLAVVGFNLARFMMPIESTTARVRAGLRTVGRVAIPTVLWVAVGLVATGATYGIGTLFLVNNYIGPRSHGGDHWHFWFIEVFVHVILLTTLLLAIPAVRRVERRFPYAFPLALLAALLVLRWEWAWLGDWYNLRFRTHGIAWFFALGWLVQRSNTPLRRVVTTALCVALIPGFFNYPPREWFIATCLIALTWSREIPMPRIAVRPIALVASASMWILISHFTIWPILTDWFVLPVAYAGTIAAGVGVWAVAEWCTARLVEARRFVRVPRAASRDVAPSTELVHA
ncbi:AMP-binding protein [Ilumatobacter nonamiensis]|uniref:AMP-binding protein n=1 Tax=Ilumatobacter nonamiensis TaxID=467093 RepID=UPI000345BDA9|nr:AMP-binding protein [Ilumatobacter nonamiensis]